MKDFVNYSLLNHNTFGMDVKAKRYVEYDSEDELVQLLSSLQGKVLHIGGGSNLLFCGDFDGTILHSAIKGIEVVEDVEGDDEVLVRVGAGEVWDDFVAWAVAEGYGGVENLSLIPGEVGASAVQNIGAYGVEAKDVIAMVEAVDMASGEKRLFANAECGYAYRQSIFKQELKGKYAITYVIYRLQKQPKLKLEYGNILAALEDKAQVTVADVRRAIIDIRNAKLPDPKVVGNAGSFFMNPVVSREKFLSIQKDYPTMPFYDVDGGVKIPAGWLIEQCGWKGKSLGRAGVHDKQALVLVNRGGASSEEIVTLCNTICKDVHERFGIDIHPEVNFI
ncbi:MAG: UDP-N-acetylmuramate dehydrogenase [Bacteroidaceae bacterium]|jgi:UDP-N-acetylmuramate dehydrogenase|nr:UDP-N-acetylmuramate dehydrogenase [Bacteroidaceae bacterium]